MKRSIGTSIPDGQQGRIECSQIARITIGDIHN